MTNPMNNEALIEMMAAGVKPVPRRDFAQRFGAGLGLGLMACLLLVALALGFRPDLGWAVQHHTFWVKLGYCASIALLATLATARLGRPDAGALGWLLWLAVPVCALAALAMFDLARAAPDQTRTLWLGASWRICSALVFLLSLPVFGGLLLALRWLAPTRLRAAGAAAGLAAGAWAACLYCLHCPETAAPFILVWYSAGIALATGLGALLGPRLLRW